MVIWKYVIKVSDYIPLELAAGYEILCVKPSSTPQNLHLYVKHTDPFGPKVICRLEIVGTGNEFENDSIKRKYIGTVEDGPFFWHVFECLL